MNKKFSTLVAGVLLATSVGTVNAQSFVATQPKAANVMTKLDKTQYFQLAGGVIVDATPAVTDSVLAMVGTPATGYSLASVDGKTAPSTQLNNTLWSISWRDNGFGTLLFTLTNKGTGEVLSVDTRNADKDTQSSAVSSKNGGSISEWRWSNIVEEGTKKFDDLALEASFAGGDSIVSLVAVTGKVVAVKTANNKSIAGALKAVPYTANSVALTAYDLNTRLQSIVDVTNFNLKFSPDAQNNQWENWLSKQSLIAEGVDATNFDVVATTPTADRTETWVRLHDAAASSTKYAYLDTAYIAENNVAAADLKLRFALAESKATTVVATDKAMKMRGAFKFTLFPSNDSLAIAIANVDLKVAGTTFWKDNTYTTTAAAAANFVKLVYLTDGTGGTKVHSEVTVGAPETGNTLRTKVTLTEDAKTARVKTTLPSGLYFINLNTDVIARKALNGAYWTANIIGDQLRYANEESSQSLGTIQNFGHMPQAQWVVEQSTYGVAGQQTVTITNREFPAKSIANVQLYKAGDGSVQAVYAGLGTAITAADSLTFAEVKTVKPEVTAAYTDTYFGYQTIDSTVLAERIFNLDYLSGIKMGNYVNVLDSKTDSIIYVDVKGEKVTLVLETAPAKAEGFYGYQGALATGANKLFSAVRRTAYNLKIKDSNKLIANSKYVVRVDGDKNATGKPVYAISDVEKTDAAMFFLKENNNVVPEEGKDVCYYALIEAAAPAFATATDTLYTIGANRAGIKDGSLVMSSEKNTEERIAAFALTEDNSPLYRRLGVTNKEDGLANNDTVWAKIYTINSTAKEYLYEDAYSKYSVDANGKSLGINFLGLEGKGDNPPSALYIDTAYVRYNTNMPQYMIAVDVTTVPDGLWCPDNAEHNSPEYIATHGDCGHRVPTQGYKMGRYLINAEDSVQTAVNGKDYIWNREYTRLAFVQAKHIGDTLVICRNSVPSKAAADSIFLGNNDHNKTTTARPYGTKNPVFAFRLINDEPQADFLIESEGDHKIPSAVRSGWIKIQNGVPVIARYQTGYNEAITDAEKFNIDVTSEIPTTNDDINTTVVSVVAGEGQVVIKNAANKTVAISNILGQTIANTVVTSDNATISVPAGIVVVAVEGEAAVKAIIK